MINETYPFDDYAETQVPQWVIIRNVENSVVGYRAIVEIDPEDGELGDIVCNPSPMGESNARLIAAAPELLAALEKIDANAAENPEWIRRVCREAIRQAKGET